jgi:hypothetical protein
MTVMMVMTQRGFLLLVGMVRLYTEIAINGRVLSQDKQKNRTKGYFVLFFCCK